MTEAKPEIRCVDYWPEGIPRNKLLAYKLMIDAGQITKPHATGSRSTGAVAVQYLSTIPHEWMRQELAKLAEAIA